MRLMQIMCNGLQRDGKALVICIVSCLIMVNLLYNYLWVSIHTTSTFDPTSIDLFSILEEFLGFISQVLL